jgi:hypothetical protein
MQGSRATSAAGRGRASAAISSWRPRLPLAVFLLLAGVYLLTMSGHTYSPDEETMLAVTRALLASGSPALPDDGAPLSALRPGLDGGRYSPYGALPSLLALPLQALGGLVAPLGAPAADYLSRFLVTALNGPVTAATAALLAAWALRLGAARPWALGLALLYGLGTFAWPYARTFFSEPLAALLILLAAERAHAAHAKCDMQHAKGGGDEALRSARRDLFISGLACGLLLTTRIAAGVAVPVIGLYVLSVCWRAARNGTGRRAALFASGILHFAFGLLPGLAVLAWYNLARFGTPLATGYASEAELFTTPLLVGLHGLLLSPGKSVLLFAPPLLLALPGAVALWRRGERGVVLLAFGLFVTHLVLYARWSVWDGGGVWGPRFLLPVVAPLLALAAGLWRAGGGRLTAGAAAGALVGLVAVAGFAGNLGGVLLNFGTYVVAPSPYDKLYSLAGSPLVGHWRTLAERWGRYGAAGPACRLGDGLHATEDPAGGALPRRTGAVGELRCEAVWVVFTLDDRRPPEAPPSELRLLLDGREVGAPPPGQLREYRLLLPPGGARLELAARTWNPLAAGFSDRDDELGPQLGALRGAGAAGERLAVVDTAVAPLPQRPRPRWAWYYDPPNQHLVDHWAWYLPRSELAGPAAWALGGVILLLGAGLVGAGVWGVRRGLWPPASTPSQTPT